MLLCEDTETPIGVALGEATEEARAEAGRGCFFPALTLAARQCGVYGRYLGCLQYAQLLRDWVCIYTALEEALEQLPPPLQALNLEEVRCVQDLESDLVVL